MTRSRIFQFLCIVTPLATVGCPDSRPIPTFMTKQDAVNVVNRNLDLIDGGLRARGQASGWFVDAEGRRQSFNLSARILVVPPNHLHLLLEHPLAGDELRLGANDEKWWLWSKRPEPHVTELERGQEAIISGQVPIQADQLLGAVGLLPLNTLAAQRITDDYQQIIYVARKTSPTGDEFEISNEFWLDRYAPWLIRRVVYRDQQGRSVFTSDLGKYRLTLRGNAMMPHEMVLRWPSSGAEMTLELDRWIVDPDLTDRALPFMAPSDRPTFSTR